MNQYIKIPSTTPNIGDYFEGGYYIGMIWVELVQSSTLTVNDVGAKSFFVPDITNPIVYQGQLLEVRSRSNPNNKMTGTLVDAS